MEITRIHAEKIVELIDHGLVSGLGHPKPGEMCIEAAVCYALDLPHGDDPGCVLPSLRRMKIRINDLPWSSNAARAAGMKRLGLAQLGSLELDERVFNNRIAKMLISRVLPRVLRNAGKRTPSHADRLEAAAARCETDPTAEAVQAAIAVAKAAAYAVYAVYAAVRAAIAVAKAARAAHVEAAAIAKTVAEAAAGAAAIAIESDLELAFLCEEIVQVLVEMKAPGCQWLYLAPLAA